MRNKGFTIMELMCVIGIMGIMVGIIMPAYRGYIPKMRLKSARDQVFVTLRLARTRALSERQIYQVIFEKATNTYKINPGGASTPLPTGITMPIAANITYEFRPNRTAAMIPGNVTLQNRRGQTVAFQLTAATGHIEVQE
jgi:prepilin-type N-terminal cleavage/methylation domain-containing protein